MPYQAKRKKRFEEDFELCNESGEAVHTIHVSLDADDMVVKINRKYTALVRALSETQDVKRKALTNEELEGCFEKLGRAVVDMLEAVFGSEDAKTIVDFYDNRYIEMCREVVPFITQVVLPRCAQIKKENQKGILQDYNRKQRRSMFKRVK